MNTALSALVGVLFLALAFAGTFLMYRIWGYPYDGEAGRSTAPAGLVLTHRILGVCYVIVYLLMMWHMVPRLLEYQVEFPVRTVLHFTLGVTIGFLLVLKLAIIRFFRHFSAALPYLGSALLWCTAVLVTMSVPFSLKEWYWSGTVAGGDAFSSENIARVSKVLPVAGFPDEAPLDRLASERGLKFGRRVLLSRCVTCHDLKTVLSRPRTAVDWVRTVERMAQRPIFGNPIELDEQWAVASYLIAISPELQQSVKRRRQDSARAAEARDAVRAVVDVEAGEKLPVSGFDLTAAGGLFEQTCSQCHGLEEVEAFPLPTMGAVQDLLGRMVDNGLDATEPELEQVARYLHETYVR